MTRPVRTIVVLGAIAVAGFLGLALLADRYRKAIPTRSVYDLPASSPAPAPVEAPRAAEPATMPEPSTAPRAAPSAATPAKPAATAPALREVDAFIAARKAMKAVMDQRPGMMAKLRAEVAGDTSVAKNNQPRAYFDLFFEIVLAQKHALGEKGLEVDSYDRVLKEYLARKAGKPPGNAAIAAALEARKDALADADFGDYAFFDTIRSD